MRWRSSTTATPCTPTSTCPPRSSNGWRAERLSGPPVVILCGGRGARLREHAQELPKPLVEIGGMPIVWHVIQLYAARGFRRFVLATGFRGELIEHFVGSTPWPQGVVVECVDTGADTPTGGRLEQLEGQLGGEEVLCATDDDGLGHIHLVAA